MKVNICCCISNERFWPEEFKYQHFEFIRLIVFTLFRFNVTDNVYLLYITSNQLCALSPMNIKIFFILLSAYRSLTAAQTPRNKKHVLQGSPMGRALSKHPDASRVR